MSSPFSNKASLSLTRNDLWNFIVIYGRKFCNISLNYSFKKLSLKLIGDLLKYRIYYKKFIYRIWEFFVQIWKIFEESSILMYHICILFIYHTYIYLTIIVSNAICIWYRLYICINVSKCIYSLLFILYQRIVYFVISYTFVLINVFKLISSLFYICIIYLKVFLFTIIDLYQCIWEFV